jgi:hypothetical protein
MFAEQGIFRASFARRAVGTTCASSTGVRSVWGRVGIFLAPIAACSTTTGSGPSGGLDQYTTELRVDAGRRVVVLAVDDGPSAAATSVRETATGLLRATLENRFAAGVGGGLGSDWARADLRVVVVHPSNAGSARAVGPSDDPGLAVVAANASTRDIDAMADAAGRAIDANVAPAGAPYTLLDATARTLRLVTGARAPEDAHEADLVASLGTPEVVAFVIATSRDDEGAESVGEDAAWRPPIAIEGSALFAPLTGAGAPCSGTRAPPTRLGAWAAALHGTDVYTRDYDPACIDDAAELVQTGFLGAAIGEASAACFPAPLAHDADGAGACVVTATMDDGGPCSSHPGMVDPEDADGVRRPRAVSVGARGTSRVCEVRALVGEQAAACRESAACTGCGPGWCDTRTVVEGCGGGGSFRMVHGAVPPGAATLDLTCNLATR